ncbi:MAG: hypothetical protein IJD51_00540 [Clostridia bacterium]|nr:hypothetical protein [Clostridia bacterium]
MAKKKKKKEKITYIDDGRTIADMSGTSKPSPILGSRSRTSERGKRRAGAREQWNTYKTAAKQMFLPMLVVMGIITVAFGVMYLLLKYGV